MAFDGSGIFLRLRNWVADATAGVKIRADFHDTEDDNFASGLSQCIVKDGQTTITQNIPFNSKRVVALADPVDPQDAATKHYADTKAALDGSAPFTGDVTIRGTDPGIILDGTAGHANTIQGAIGGKPRWLLQLGDGAAETGGNAGSNYSLFRYADDGSFIDQVMNINRATGLGTVKANPTAPLGISTKQYADTKLSLTGGTVTGTLQITAPGNLVANGYIGVGGAVYFGVIGSSNAWIYWQGGDTYNLGPGSGGTGGGTIWHSGNLHPTVLQDLTTRIEALEARIGK